MATSTLVPLDEYLHTSYEHDREWVNGEVKERGVPDGYHSYFQGWFLLFFSRGFLRLRGLSEVRMRVCARSYRIPDVMVIPADVPFLPSPTAMPLICIEILSPDDRVSDLQEKIEDYVSVGIEHIWIVDPRRRTMATADAEGTHTVQAFRVPGTDAQISAAELFGELDELESRGTAK
jgi:Uma2 family endonuclease